MPLLYDRIVRAVVLLEDPASFRLDKSKVPKGVLEDLKRQLTALEAEAGSDPSRTEWVKQQRARLSKLLQDQQVTQSGEGTALEFYGGAETLAIKLKIEKSHGKHPNTGEVTIRNLARPTRDALDAKGARPKVLVEGGYIDGVSLLATGDARSVDHVQGNDGTWETRIQFGDGERGFSWGRITASFAPNTTYGAVVEQLAAALGAEPGNLRQHRAALDTFKLAAGWVAHGNAAAELETLLNGIGWEWSIQDGALQLDPPDPTRTKAIVLSPASGLIMPAPQLTKGAKNKGARLKGRCFMNGEIGVGSYLQLEDTAHAGLYRAEKVTHAGDTHGSGAGSWVTEFEARAVP